MMKRHDARSSTGLRPRRSAKSPVIGDAKRANSEVEEVINDFDKVLSGAPERSS